MRFAWQLCYLGITELSILRCNYLHKSELSYFFIFLVELIAMQAKDDQNLHLVFDEYARQAFDALLSLV